MGIKGWGGQGVVESRGWGDGRWWGSRDGVVGIGVVGDKEWGGGGLQMVAV